MIFYHHHIPRTSGMFIRYPLTSLLTSKGVKYLSVYQLEQINKEEFYNVNYIFGHIGGYPIRLLDNVFEFGIVRNPIDRFLSTFNFFSKEVLSVHPTKEFLDEWLYSDTYSLPHSNLQSKSITGTIDEDKWNKSNRTQRVLDGWMFEDYSLDINKIKERIDSAYFCSLENNTLLLDKLSNIHEKEYNFTLYKRRNKINESEPLQFIPTKSQIDRIEELNQTDLELYEYVKTTENKVFK